MGKQIQIFTTENDNIIFEKYLIEFFDCILFQSSASSIEDLILKNINDTYYKFNSIYIYNKKFKWNPEYKQTETENKNYYISNTFGAPLINFSKTNWEKNENGRIYWEKNFTSNVLSYDVNEFNKFYNKIVSWFKKNSKGKDKYSNINYYYLPDAWNKKL